MFRNIAIAVCLFGAFYRNFPSDTILHSDYYYVNYVPMQSDNYNIALSALCTLHTECTVYSYWSAHSWYY